MRIRNKKYAQKPITEFIPSFEEEKIVFQPIPKSNLVMVLNPTQNWFDIALM